MAYFPLKQDSYRFSPPKSMKNYSKDSIEKMAVLFTDIVGSSKYFKKHGDIAGRKMLKLHQDIASPIIIEFGGVLVKMLGDSVMAYFFSPEEAFKSSIKIQQQFEAHNKGRDIDDQIHIRLCIHYGDGIIEEKDIFGDVVNMAAKFLPIAGSDEILISGEVHKQINKLPSVHFIPVEITNNKKVFKGLRLFKVTWEENLSFDPASKTILYMKPTLNLAKNDFKGLWDKMLKGKANLWSDAEIDKEAILADKSVVLIVKQAPQSMAIAENIMRFLRLNMGQSGALFLPIQMVIDTGPYLSAGKLSIKNLNVNWGNIEPGEIYISGSSYKFVNEDNSFSIAVSSETSPRTFYKVIRKNQGKNEQSLFLYQNALIQGDNPPCFYCGSKRHPTRGCPSKSITDVTHFIEKLGYLPVKEINNLFFNYLNEASLENRRGFASLSTVDANSTIQLAHQAFFELTSVFQLRFFMKIWNLREDNWDKIKDSNMDQEKGGILWIALDCIRVSNYERAESIISEALSKRDHDYKVYLLAGFLGIEKNDFANAKKYLKKALDFPNKTPQSIFILFLISRIHYLSDDPLKAREMLRKILRLAPYCTEALYLDILFKLQHGDKTAAIDQLVKLIKKNRDYYLFALIDPELSNFASKINVRLEQLLMEAREKANDILSGVNEKIDSLEKIMGKDSKEVSEARYISTKMHELSKTDSYFGYLDITHYGETINKMGYRIIEKRRRRQYRMKSDLENRLKKYGYQAKKLSYSFLVDNVSYHIAMLMKKVDKTCRNINSDDPEEFEKSINRLELISKEVDGIEIKLRHLDSIAQVLIFATKFLKRTLFFQSANLIIALILFPIMTHYLNFIIPDHYISPQNIWNYQKIVLILGGLTGLILASLTSQTSPSN